MFRRCVIVWLAFAAASCHPLPPELGGGSRAPIELMSGHLLVRARANDRPLVFIVDTGASITALSRRAAARIGFVPSGRIEVNGMQAAVGVLRRFAIAGVEHRDVRVAVVDLYELDHRGDRADGVIGMDVLARHDIAVDLRRRVLSLHPPRSLANSSHAAKMARLPMERTRQGLVVLQVHIAGLGAIPAVLDLGSPVSFLNCLAAARLGQSRSTIRRQRVTVAGVELELRNVLVEDHPAFIRQGLGKRPAMLLGSDMIEHRSLAIAFGDGAAFLSR